MCTSSNAWPSSPGAKEPPARGPVSNSGPGGRYIEFTRFLRGVRPFLRERTESFSMRLLAFAAVSSLALGVAACAPHIDYAHKTSLDCPDRLGGLQRTGMAADRKTCAYRANGGTEVTLQLVPVNGDAGATLGAI